ncbi:MAG TPA: PAS domain-containing protein, partial [Allocoleopsis sp.]
MTPDQKPSWRQYFLSSTPSRELPPANIGAKYQVFLPDSYRTNVELQQHHRLSEPHPSIQLDLDSSGTITAVNPSGAAYLGYSAQELIGRPVLHLVYPDDQVNLRIKLTEFLQSVTTPEADVKTAITISRNWELRQVCKDGRVIWVKAVAQPTTNRNGHTTTAIQLECEDITEWKQVEAGFQQESSFLAAILDTVANLIIVLDAQGRIVRFNRACEQTTGYTFAEVKGVPFWDILLLPEEVAGVKAGFSQLRAGLFPNEYENHWVTKAGVSRFIAWSNTAILGQEGKVEYIIGTGLDVTERRQTELALQRSQQQQYQHLVESVEGIVWEADAETLQFSFVSPKAERILGYPLADWLDDAEFWLKHLHPDDRAWVVASCRQETQARRNHTLEYRMIAQDGTVAWFRDMITVVPDSEPLQLRGVMLDITERRQAEIALQMSEA